MHRQHQGDPRKGHPKIICRTLYILTQLKEKASTL